MESDARFYRRRADEEIAAAKRAVTEAARDRRMLLAGIFLDRLNDLESRHAADQARRNAGETVGWRERAFTTL